MKNQHAQAKPLLSGEKELQELGIAYEKQADDTLLVRGSIRLSGKGMTQLPDLSNVDVLGNFQCDSNLLINLKGSPRSVGEGFYCYNNQLVTLEGASRSVKGTFYCSCNRRLANLEGAPEDFKNLYSDLGRFSSWADVPENLRTSPETRKRLKKEAEEAAAAAAREQLLRRVCSPAVPKGGMVLRPLALNLPPKTKKATP